MIFFGHVGITLFLGSLLSLSLIFVLLGSVAPDIIDKSLVVLNIAPYGRFVGHTLLAAFLVAGFTGILLRKREASISLLFGYLAHLVEDSRHFVPWFYPFVDYVFKPYRIKISLGLFEIAAEIVGVLALVYIIKTNRRFQRFLLSPIDSFRIELNGRKIPEY